MADVEQLLVVLSEVHLADLIQVVVKTVYYCLVDVEQPLVALLQLDLIHLILVVVVKMV